MICYSIPLARILLLFPIADFPEKLEIAKLGVPFRCWFGTRNQKHSYYSNVMGGL